MEFWSMTIAGSITPRCLELYADENFCDGIFRIFSVELADADLCSGGYEIKCTGTQYFI